MVSVGSGVAHHIMKNPAIKDRMNNVASIMYQPKAVQKLKLSVNQRGYLILPNQNRHQTPHSFVVAVGNCFEGFDKPV